MKRIVLLVLASCAALAPCASDASTNAADCAASASSAADAPAEKPAPAQCEAVTKSGARCKRNALPGGKLCRQHQKIADSKGKR